MSGTETGLNPMLANLADQLEWFVRDAENSVIFNDLTGHANPALTSEFGLYLQASDLFYFRLIEKLLREHSDADRRYLSQVAARVTVAALLEYFLSHHPELVTRLHRHLEPRPEDMNSSLLRLQHGIHDDNPTCQDCGSETRVVGVEQSAGIVMYQCRDLKRAGCNRHFTNKSL